MAPQVNWSELGFNYMQTDSYVVLECNGGTWGGPQVRTDPQLSLHIGATCMHYGQAAFEGLKAFRAKDGSVAVFRPMENIHRMAATAERLVMQSPPDDLYLEAIRILVDNNRAWVPPHGTGASLYIRPLLIGTTACVGVKPALDYMLIIMCMPVGPYYKNGFFPVKACIQEKYDRAAPHGVGNVKASGNYAAGMLGDLEGKKQGYPICLYLDSAEHRYIDEFGTSNFIGITKDNKYVTPASKSILPSITNSSLEQLACDAGMTVERRPILVDELTSFTEVGACGTAAVITPVYSITRGDTVYTFGEEKQAGAVLTKLYNELQGIQYGERPDTHNWMYHI